MQLTAQQSQLHWGNRVSQDAVTSNAIISIYTTIKLIKNKNILTKNLLEFVLGQLIKWTVLLLLKVCFIFTSNEDIYIVVDIIATKWLKGLFERTFFKGEGCIYVGVDAVKF